MIDKHFVLTAGNVEPSAGGGGHPQVAGAGVEDNVEVLARSSQLDGSVILSLKYRISIQGRHSS